MIDDTDSDGIIEVNKDNLLNYESDDSDDDVEVNGIDNDSDDFGQKLKKQKQEFLMNDTWGT